MCLLMHPILGTVFSGFSLSLYTHLCIRTYIYIFPEAKKHTQFGWHTGSTPYITIYLSLLRFSRWLSDTRRNEIRIHTTLVT